MVHSLSAADVFKEIEGACRRASFAGYAVQVTTHLDRVTITVGDACSAWFILERAELPTPEGEVICKVKSYVDLLGGSTDRAASIMAPKLVLAFQVATWALSLERVFFLSGSADVVSSAYAPVVGAITGRHRRCLHAGGYKYLRLDDFPETGAQLEAVLEQEGSVEFSVEGKGYKVSKGRPDHGEICLMRVYLALKVSHSLAYEGFVTQRKAQSHAPPPRRPCCQPHSPPCRTLGDPLGQRG